MKKSINILEKGDKSLLRINSLLPESILSKSETSKINGAICGGYSVEYCKLENGSTIIFQDGGCTIKIGGTNSCIVFRKINLT